MKFTAIWLLIVSSFAAVDLGISLWKKSKPLLYPFLIGTSFASSLVWLVTR